MQILIAEDDELILKTIEHKLKKEGYKVVLTRNGKEAISKIETEDIDLIITDIMMPFASGLEIISAVRKSKNSDTPMIILSSLGQEDVVVEAFNLGANDFMVKPFSPIELSVRVKKLLK
ncbi:MULTISPECIES: response regulator transcription factor [Empedobacter]|jgi:DNA-binding response OmpR family regulator|uniref:DNA-binding response regulator n=1 Tax=Empedobacter falsenii TaxID=343874 RepID=A0A376GJR1_9FLAO|nr:MULTISPECIES: response regulator transcription factor [Empedobacter]HAR72402.1 response regulator [Flavobacteriaceae bacterium]MDH1883526.1 response regulator transcription factor [Empedobacter sp. GD03797]MDM1041049.1 response regulator transcription factor [Empedobacter brevis]MDM1134885.1 response regulator transcription factor [Empedobacter sp. R750]MDM1297813.1 response regulator transcription factor [Empedobacter falsenii]